jgi:hypothetical protein
LHCWFIIQFTSHSSASRWGKQCQLIITLRWAWVAEHQVKKWHCKDTGESGSVTAYLEVQFYNFLGITQAT